MIKRLIDLILAVVMMPIVLPAIAVISVGIMCTMGIPIFFRQTRVGKDRVRFRIFKFRTMSNAIDTGDISEDMSIKDLIEKRKAYQTTSEKDKRISNFGSFLRKHSLDELPQIFNIIKGDMSFVGPRPDAPHQRADYPAHFWVTRHHVKPGLTGLAQINGRSSLNLNERTALDLKYSEKHSLKLDLAILLQTIYHVISFKNSN